MELSKVSYYEHFSFSPQSEICIHLLPFHLMARKSWYLIINNNPGLFTPQGRANFCFRFRAICWH